VTDDLLEVRVDQSLCTGDGICVEYAPDVFELDIDGLAYVKGPDGELLADEGARVLVPLVDRADVLEAARKCPGVCIHVLRSGTDDAVAGPDA
jgi:ferredoxin